MWKCPKCGRGFRKENQSHYCGKAPETVDEYIAAQKMHIGLYPGPEAVENFSDQLDQAGLKYSKGSIQIPYSGELPLGMIAEIADRCRKTGNHA